MSAVERAAQSPVRVDARPGLCTDQFRFCWLVSRAALRRCNGAPAKSAAPFAGAALPTLGPECEIIALLDAKLARFEVFARDPATNAEIPLFTATHARIDTQPAAGLLSLDVTDVAAAPLLRAVVDDSGRVLYAYAPFLAAIGLEGGRYELHAPHRA